MQNFYNHIYYCNSLYITNSPVRTRTCFSLPPGKIFVGRNSVDLMKFLSGHFHNIRFRLYVLGETPLQDHNTVSPRIRQPWLPFASRISLQGVEEVTRLPVIEGDVIDSDLISRVYGRDRQLRLPDSSFMAQDANYELRFVLSSGGTLWPEPERSIRLSGTNVMRNFHY
jgi:hypothetical protein